ncbi:MAG: WD40/YVTN/BNR-like repeat-containing protein, partial [Candidatus Kapaibacterium sp.]
MSIAHGYLATSNGVYETNDTGSTWKVILPNNSISCVYAADNTLFAIINQWSLVSTKDDGRNWNHLPITGNYVFGNKDSLVYSSDIIAGTLWYSTNCGKDWASNSLDLTTKGIFCFPNCNDLLRTNIFIDTYPITHSSDYGKTWQTYLPQPEIGAWFSGNGCAVYISNATSPAGLLRSVDRGKTWQSSTGPNFREIDDHDFRNLSVVGNGAVVYACDINGLFWKTTDGGDGVMSLNSFPTGLVLKCDLPAEDSLLYSAICDTLQFQFSLENLSCNSLHFKSLSIDGLDSSEYKILLKSHSSCSGIPDTLGLLLLPVVTGIRPIVIHEHFLNNESRTFDTSFALTLNIAPLIHPAVLAKSSRLDTPSGTIDFGSKAICFGGGLDTILLSNPSCAGVLISNINLEPDSNSKKDFSLSTISPFDLKNWTSPDKIVVNYDPLTPGRKSAMIIIETSLGKDTIRVFGYAIADTARLVIKKSDTVKFDARP